MSERGCRGVRDTGPIRQDAAAREAEAVAAVKAWEKG